MTSASCDGSFQPVRQLPGGHDLDFGPGGVVGSKHSGRPCLAGSTVDHLDPEHLGELRSRHPAGAEQDRLVADQLDDRRLDADLGGAKLTGTNLNQANLAGIKLDGAAIERVLVHAARQPPAQLDTELDGGQEP